MHMHTHRVVVVELVAKCMDGDGIHSLIHNRHAIKISSTSNC